MPVNNIPGPSAVGPIPNANSLAVQQQQQALMARAAVESPTRVSQETQSQIQTDKSRVTLLLEINSELLRETVTLQAAGKPAQEDKNPDRGFLG